MALRNSAWKPDSSLVLEDTLPGVLIPNLVLLLSPFACMSLRSLAWNSDSGSQSPPPGGLLADRFLEASLFDDVVGLAPAWKYDSPLKLEHTLSEVLDSETLFIALDFSCAYVSTSEMNTDSSGLGIFTPAFRARKSLSSNLPSFLLLESS